jgi:hypothetical protein
VARAKVKELAPNAPTKSCDEAFLPGPMRLTQHHRESLLKAPIELRKLRVLVAFRVLGFVFLPEKGKGDLVVAPREFLAHPRPVGKGPCRRTLRGAAAGAAIELARELNLIELGDLRPGAEPRESRST